MVLASPRSRLRYRDLRRAARPVPRRALPANATEMNASPNPWALPRRTPDAPAGDGYMALRSTLWVDLLTINSRWRVSARIAAGCGFLATTASP